MFPLAQIADQAIFLITCARHVTFLEAAIAPSVFFKSLRSLGNGELQSLGASNGGAICLFAEPASILYFFILVLRGRGQRGSGG